MRLGIDLRFYRPEPYGLAVHIRDLMTELVPLLEASETLTTVVLIVDARIAMLDLHEYLPWWETVTTSNKFVIHFSSVHYYSLREQTTFLFELNKMNLDVMYFFTFNYPILYHKPYIYQVLDLSIPKTRSHFSLKVQGMLLCLRLGINNAKHILFLGNNTRSDVAMFSNANILDSTKPHYIPNTVIYNGINTLYLSMPSADEQKAKQLQLPYAETKRNELVKLKTHYSITKPYFFFVSVWRKYKNIELLAAAFNSFNEKYDDQYQLVLGGEQDSKYPEIYEYIKTLEQYKKGNIIVTGRIQNDEDVILLYDGAEALIAPSLSEGFGLWMVEAAARGLPVIASDIPIFHEIAGDAALYFDPYSEENLISQLDHFVNLSKQKHIHMQTNLFEITKKFRWGKTARDIYTIIHNV